MMKIAAKVAPKKDELALLKEIGYENVEVYTNDEYIKNKIDCAKILNSFDFDYAVHAPKKFYDESVINFADSIGAKIVVVHHVLAADKLAEIVNKAKNYGIVVCIEFGGSEHLHDSKEFFDLKKKIKDLKMCMDMEHTVNYNVFPEIIRKVGRSISHVHISGSPPGLHHPPQDNLEFVRAAIRELKKINYEGFVVAEMDLEYQTKKIFIETKKFLEQVIND
jgi:sugar phosphate isomerase/epimerase